MRFGQRMWLACMLLCLVLLSACGSAGTGEPGSSEYRSIKLVMSVNGTDTQITLGTAVMIEYSLENVSEPE